MDNDFLLDVGISMNRATEDVAIDRERERRDIVALCQQARQAALSRSPRATRRLVYMIGRKLSDLDEQKAALYFDRIDDLAPLSGHLPQVAELLIEVLNDHR